MNNSAFCRYTKPLYSCTYMAMASNVMNDDHGVLQISIYHAYAILEISIFFMHYTFREVHVFILLWSQVNHKFLGAVTCEQKHTIE